MYYIEKDLLNIAQTPLVKSQFIIAHEAGNPNNTGENSLANEVAYMKRNWQQAFVSHWVGSGGRIIQIAQTGLTQWGVGPRGNPYAYAQVELARTRNGSKFQKDYAAYVWLLRELALEGGIPLALNTGNSVEDAGIKTHSWVTEHLGGTTHVDPDGYLARWGISMEQFKRDFEKPLNTVCYRLHLVVKGDTLWSLSQRFGLSVAELKQLNGLSSDLIVIGQILKVAII